MMGDIIGMKDITHNAWHSKGDLIRLLEVSVIGGSAAEPVSCFYAGHQPISIFSFRRWGAEGSWFSLSEVSQQDGDEAEHHDGEG